MLTEKRNEQKIYSDCKLGDRQYQLLLFCGCLTWNNLQNSVLLHVGWKVPSSHVLLHYSHVGQFLGRNQAGEAKFFAQIKMNKTQ